MEDSDRDRIEKNWKKSIRRYISTGRSSAAIRRKKDSAGFCESAVEYEEMTEYEKTPEMQSELHSNLIQTVYETELVYVYEDAKTAGQRFRLSVQTAVHRFRSWG